MYISLKQIKEAVTQAYANSLDAPVEDILDDGLLQFILRELEETHDGIDPIREAVEALEAVVRDVQDMIDAVEALNDLRSK